MASPDSEKPTLNDQTASNAIISRFYLGGQPYALGTMSNVGEDNRVDFNLVPGRRNMPDAGISLEQGEKGDRSGTFTVGNPDLRYTGKVRLPEDGGSSTRHRLEGGIGPFGAHYMRSEFPEGDGKEIGGSLNIGPFTLFGNRATSQQNVIPEAYRGYFTNPNVDATSTTLGARGSGDVGIGTLSGGAERTNSSYQLPRFIGQESRTTAQDQRTMYNLGLSGGLYDIGGTLTDVRGVGTEYDLRGSYKWLDLPFNLPGNLDLTGGWRKPMGEGSSGNVGVRYNPLPDLPGDLDLTGDWEMGDKSSANVGFRYTLPF